ncbi:LacI family DNA-binding transcriptional regulator [Mycetocola miduiensis]|uniref:Transcriptional regulator, LacI family n=1 Tax=Mycetocola miduiensis TaxID=995034 RepID=A0A1I4Z0X5_9MICO|nr:LacI family DNA-binding transcriptional regulator [Mycetocola miduiensis]SFN43878.1 transcriptional regulator, LacI family [Mycetocola miduiensis]
MVNRNDVARLAGVSTAVVSYVMNGGPRVVSAESRAKVEAAVRELGYRPNGLARALKLQRTAVLGIVVPDSSNPYFAELARAIEEAAYAQGMTLLLGNSAEDPARELAYLSTFLNGRVDGILIVSSSRSPDIIDLLDRSGLPSVFVDRSPVGNQHSAIEVDNRAGGREAVAHLLEHGHRNVTVVVGPSAQSDERMKGALEAVVGRDDVIVRQTSSVRFARSAGYAAGREILATDDRPSAVFTVADELAIGVLRAAADSGLRVPEDLAVVSFDGIPEAAFTAPGLSTIGQPFERIAQEAVGLLMAMVDSDVPPQCVVLPVALIRRGSCGCPDDLHIT